MRTVLRPAVLIALALTGWLDLAAAQDLHPSRRPSPMGMARITLGDTYVRVVYSRPYKRGRENIFGTEESEALVPYGKIWRTGANEGTEITVTGDVTMAGERLPAGTYTIFSTPGENTWEIHFNSTLGVSGTGFFDAATREFTPVDVPATDVLVVEAEVASLEEESDQFTIALEASNGGADLCFRWIKTEVCVPVAAP
jgi:hypothetical protein